MILALALPTYAGHCVGLVESKNNLNFTNKIVNLNTLVVNVNFKSIHHLHVISTSLRSCIKLMLVITVHDNVLTCVISLFMQH